MGASIWSARLKKGGAYYLNIGVDSLEERRTASDHSAMTKEDQAADRRLEILLYPSGRATSTEAGQRFEDRLTASDLEVAAAEQLSAALIDLPPEPVAIGETWTTKAVIKEGTNRSETSINLDILNTLEGFETMDGMECVRIKAEFTGTVEGTSEPEPGVELVSEGEVKGTDIWYFAFKEGIFVKTVSNGTADIIATASVQGISIPMKREFSGEMVLIK